MLGFSSPMLGKGGGAGGGGPFSPATLFGSGQTGGWWDVTDLSAVFQDIAATTAGAVNSPVGRINDKSGNGNHLLFSGATTTRPTLRSGYLEFDGVDDTLATTLTMAQPCERITTLRQIVYTSNTYLLSGQNGSNGSLPNYATSPEICLYNGTVACTNTTTVPGTDFCADEIHNGASSSLTVNNGTAATGNPGTPGPGGMRIGSSGSNGNFANMRFYASVLRSGTLTSTERANLRTYIGARAGLTL